MKILGHTQV
jgi:hypothetical protein